MNEKDKVWYELGKAWDKFTKKAREYCELSTQFQCDAELIGYCIGCLPREGGDIEDVMEWIQQGVDSSESQKIISKQISEMRSENNVKD